MMVSFVLSFFPRDVLDEILNLIESVSEDFPSYSCNRISYTVSVALKTKHCSNGLGHISNMAAKPIYSMTGNY